MANRWIADLGVFVEGGLDQVLLCPPWEIPSSLWISFRRALRCGILTRELSQGPISALA